jgi:hypothetical protein
MYYGDKTTKFPVAMQYLFSNVPDAANAQHAPH